MSNICTSLKVMGFRAGGAAQDYFPVPEELVVMLGPDVSYEIGAQETISLAVANARKGSTIVVVGVFGKKPEVDIGLVQDRELNVVGTLMYQRRDYETAIRLIDEKRVDLEKLITDRFPFEDYLPAYQYIEGAKDRAMKVMIALD